MIEDERVKKLNDHSPSSEEFVFYWMQQAQRTHYNHALEYAIQKANQLNKPMVVYFGITDQFPEANLRHYQFMIQGLRVVQDNLAKRNIQFNIQIEHPVDGISTLAEDACMVKVWVASQSQSKTPIEQAVVSAELLDAVQETS